MDNSYTTYLGMDNFMIAGWRLNSWLDSAIQALNNRDEAINFIHRTATYPLKKSYPLFEQLGPELQSLSKHISLTF